MRVVLAVEINPTKSYNYCLFLSQHASWESLQLATGGLSCSRDISGINQANWMHLPTVWSATGLRTSCRWEILFSIFSKCTNPVLSESTSEQKPACFSQAVPFIRSNPQHRVRGQMSRSSCRWNRGCLPDQTKRRHPLPWAACNYSHNKKHKWAEERRLPDSLGKLANSLSSFLIFLAVCPRIFTHSVPHSLSIALFFLPYALA